MGLYAGLSAEESKRWGQFTTFKANAPELLERARLRDAIVYCSPLVDPYQPVERTYELMPRLLSALLRQPPRVFTIQTRAPLITRDLDLLKQLSAVTQLRVSMSVTTDQDSVRKRYEPFCEPNGARLAAIVHLREQGIETYATLAPLLPCNPEHLAALAIAASERDLIGDPLHIRSSKPHGATTRKAAYAIARRGGEEQWFQPEFQREVTLRIQQAAAQRGLNFEIGTRGFALLARADRLTL